LKKSVSVSGTLYHPNPTPTHFQRKTESEPQQGHTAQGFEFIRSGLSVGLLSGVCGGFLGPVVVFSGCPAVMVLE